jgi:hypothetical protein
MMPACCGFIGSSLSPNNEEVAIPKATIKTKPQISPGVFLCRLKLFNGMSQNSGVRRPLYTDYPQEARVSFHRLRMSTRNTGDPMNNNSS